ncbi:acetate/propionate family kinase [Undibacterium sp. TJN25]|uniref:acetate/propionate family kinase n=1 Tax=Undibacterium sp. TJN25 TaxID=3413056 RepID=UPI003BF04908
MDAVSGHTPAKQAGQALHVLALNSGSSSLKFGLYRVQEHAVTALISGTAEQIGGQHGKFSATDARGKAIVSESAAFASQLEAIARIAVLMNDSGLPASDAIGHRIVHGGPALRQHCIIDETSLRQLETAAAFAPLHAPAALSAVRHAKDYFGDLPQIACFDTAFHADMPELAKTLPLPAELGKEGIQRYGFHGLSCESIVRQLGEALPQRMIIAHLGNGASITAVRDGKSVDTSMGLTPTGGIIMGTRSGDLDPGILVYLMREKKFDAEKLEDLLDHKSGLLGISGIGSDMRKLHLAATSSVDAQLAIQMFCYSVQKQIAAMMAALGGVELLVFTGGIGEHDAAVRKTVCAALAWAGVEKAEARGGAENSPANGSLPRCTVQVIPSQEDEQIALHTWSLLAKNPV